MIDWYLVFLEKLFENIRKLNLELQDYSIDHIAYKCITIDEYNNHKLSLTRENNIIAENIVSWRPIAVFELNIPIIFWDYLIPVFELIAPKPWSSFKHWYEHIEFVIPDNLEEFANSYPELNFVRKFDKINNRELVLNIGDWLSIKLHNKSLLEVVRIQQITWEL